MLDHVFHKAHWEESACTVNAAKAPSLMYDYGGFPPHTYELKYDCPGSPELADEVQSLLKAAGIPCKSTTSRGLDHGVFIPLKML